MDIIVINQIVLYIKGLFFCRFRYYFQLLAIQIIYTGVWYSYLLSSACFLSFFFVSLSVSFSLHYFAKEEKTHTHVAQCVKDVNVVIFRGFGIDFIIIS